MGKGLCYGPFPPRGDGVSLPPPDRAREDLRLMASWGTDFVRLYTLPDEEFPQICAEAGVGIFQTVPWSDHVPPGPASLDEFRRNLEKIAGKSALIGLLVGNEIRSELVRWAGPNRVRELLERMIEMAREACPVPPIGYANYPGTEALMPGNADFLGLNLYLESPENYRRYLKRQQAFAGNKPLVITEFGRVASSPEVQEETWRWAMEIARQEAVAGWTGFSYTDEWWRGGRLVEEWPFGLTEADREPRPAAAVFAVSDGAYPPAQPESKFSVLVCTRNGVRTLEGCLRALEALNPAPFEIIVVDDGSDLPVKDIVQAHPGVRYERQEPMGLSVARNRAAELAGGDVFVYTDDDCEPPSDWLLWLGRIFADERWDAGGGPNLPPPPRNRTEALVAAAPGGPTHVLISEEEAEHVPGCNLAVRRAAFQAVGGFDPIYTAAGDDVDFCWRLREAGLRIGFHAGAMVWHRRRFQKRAYYRQQAGYGKAEALLMLRHPEKFGWTGGARWKGQIYGGADAWYLHGAFIYQGVTGLAPYQLIYPQPVIATARPLVWLSLPLFGLAFFRWWAVLTPLALLVFSLAPLWRFCARLTAGSWRDRALLLFLSVTAPAVRAFQRARWMRALRCEPKGESSVMPPPDEEKPVVSRRRYGTELAFWSETGADRFDLIDELRPRLASPLFSSWEREDFCVGQVSWLSVTEYHEGGRTLTRVRISAPWDRWRWLRFLSWAGWRKRVAALARQTREAATARGMEEVRNV